MRRPAPGRAWARFSSMTRMSRLSKSSRSAGASGASTRSFAALVLGRKRRQSFFPFGVRYSSRALHGEFVNSRTNASARVGLVRYRHSASVRIHDSPAHTPRCFKVLADCERAGIPVRVAITTKEKLFEIFCHRRLRERDATRQDDGGQVSGNGPLTQRISPTRGSRLYSMSLPKTPSI